MGLPICVTSLECVNGIIIIHTRLSHTNRKGWTIEKILFSMLATRSLTQERMSRANITYFFFRIVLIALLTWTFACSLLSRRSATCISFMTRFRTSKFGIFWRTNLRSSTAKTSTRATSSRWLSKRSQSFRNSSSRSASGVGRGFFEPGGSSTGPPSIWSTSTCSTTPATLPPAKHIPLCTARAGGGRCCTLSSDSTKTSRTPWFRSSFLGTSIFAVIPKVLSRLVAYCILLDDVDWNHRSTLFRN